MSRSVLAEMSFDYNQFIAVAIYFTVGLAPVYNISDHCFFWRYLNY